MALWDELFENLSKSEELLHIKSDIFLVFFNPFLKIKFRIEKWSNLKCGYYEWDFTRIDR